ncbi:hypothetical protein SAMN05192588_2334 [Nonlabens sp. Hel1_33_55]|nr:hypothetical protein SAMN05192588_2334 [Nonlabens sp. Hel1_33_55]
MKKLINLSNVAILLFVGILLLGVLAFYYVSLGPIS